MQLESRDLPFLSDQGSGPCLLLAEAHGPENRCPDADARARHSAIIDKYPTVREKDVRVGSQQGVFLPFADCES
jgi:hypothetical protein